ncbi:MAG: TolC family protein [Candidatus Azobacteroides sp.]|nr:TolC family protein [Candidatus Azobacteroides sp.]
MKKIGIIIILCFTINSVFSQNMLTLEQCKALALKNNRQIKNAELSVEKAEQQKKEAFTKYFPSVNAIGMGFLANKPLLSMDLSAMMQPTMEALTPTIGWLMQQGAPLDPAAFNIEQKIEILKNGMIAGVMAAQPIFAGGQIINGNRLAKAGIEAGRLQKQIAENDVLLETEHYFWQLVSLREKMKTIEDSEVMLLRILSDVKTAVAAGLTTSNDILRVELEQNKLESSKLKLENGMMMLKMTLGQKIGVPSDGFDIQQPEIEEITPNLYGYDNATLQNRPEYKLLEKSVEVARLQRNIEVGKNLPTVAIGAGYEYLNFDMNKKDGMNNNFGMLFANVSVPISDWWGGSHAIKRKKLELQQAENTKSDNAELLWIQMQNLQDGVNEAYQQVLVAKKSILSAEENLKISRDNYNAGIIILSDLLEAQNLLQQSRDQYAEAVTEYFVNLAEYKNATGRYNL